MRESSGELPSFLVVSQYYPPERGAAQMRLGSMVAELVRRGHRVEVLTAIPNYPTGALFPGWSRRPLQVATEGGVRTVRVWVWAAVGSGLGRMANYLSFGVMSFLAMFRTRRADWTIIEYPTLAGALPAQLWCRLARRRVVINVADLWVDAAVEVGVIPEGIAARGSRWAERWMLRTADLVTVVTEGFRGVMVDKGVAEDKIRWLPNGADTDLFSPGPGDPEARAELGAAPDEHLLLYAGTHGYVHHLDVLLDAAKLLADEPVRFALVGGGSEKDDLVARAAAEHIDNVTFHDPVPPERVADYLRVADVALACVRPGDFYRTIRSAKMLPAMAAGRPLIYAAADEGASIVAREGAGWVTPPGDAPALAAAVREVLADPAEAAARGARGREYVVAKASWTAIVGAWLAALDQVEDAP